MKLSYLAFLINSLNFLLWALNEIWQDSLMAVSNIRLLSTFSSQWISSSVLTVRELWQFPLFGHLIPPVCQSRHTNQILAKAWRTELDYSVRFISNSKCLPPLLCPCLLFSIKTPNQNKTKNHPLNFLDTQNGNWEYCRSPETSRCCIKAIWLTFVNKTDLHWNWLVSRVTIPHPRLRMLLGKPACLACKPE